MANKFRPIMAHFTATDWHWLNRPAPVLVAILEGIRPSKDPCSISKIPELGVDSSLESFQRCGFSVERLCRFLFSRQEASQPATGFLRADIPATWPNVRFGK